MGAGADRWGQRFALWVALGMVITGGLYQRWFMHADAAVARIEPLGEEALARLPLEIAGWMGRDYRLPEEVVAISDTQAHLSRVYRASGGGEVYLYVGYGVELRDLMPHRPEVCYTAAGWTQENSETVEIPAPSGEKLPCRIERFLMGGSRATVLSFYLVNGQWCRDVKGLQAEIRRARRSGESLGYAAQIQVVGFAPAELTMRDTKAMEVREFAAASSEGLRLLFK